MAHYRKGLLLSNDELNLEFYKLYVEAIKSVSSEEFLDNFFKKREKQIKKISSGIYSDSYIFDYDTKRKSGMGIYFFEKKEIYRRAESLLKSFSANKKVLYIEEGQNDIIFSSYDAKNIFLSNGKILCKNSKINLNNFQIYKKTSFFPKNHKFDETCNSVFFTDTVTEKNIKFKINKYNSPDKSVKPAKSNFLEFFYEEEKKLYLKNKKSIIHKNLFIPKGYKVIIKRVRK